MAVAASGAYPPALDKQEQDNIVGTIKDWTIGNGLAIRPPPNVIATEADPKGVSAVSAPVTIFPSPFPKVCYDQGKVAQKAYNELYAAVSQDEEFLEKAVKEVVDGDEFIKYLWDIHLKVKAEGYTQSISLGLFRSDYMVHQDSTSNPPILQAKQVEFNTIAASFGGLAYQTTALHKFLAATEYPLLRNPIPTGSLDLPTNTSTEGLAAGIAEAYRAYGEPTLGHPKCVIFLIQEGERNVFDQRHLEYQLIKSSPSTPVFRLPFSETFQHTSLADSPKRQLLYRPPQNPSRVYEVAVVYIRAGYGPGDYPDQRAWDARHHLERSAAIKCPTVLTQVAGIKKVQQILATPRPASEPSILGQFVKEDTREAQELWKTFTNIYPMDTSEAGQEARRKALDPELCKAYVLKPQREGGGNNIYRSAIPGFLNTIPESHWSTFILMELITPPPVSNLILRNGVIEQGGVICELGVYGACIWDHNTKEIKYNEELGYLLRTKGDQSEEGGVAAGYGCMDSIALV